MGGLMILAVFIIYAQLYAGIFVLQPKCLFLDSLWYTLQKYVRSPIQGFLSSADTSGYYEEFWKNDWTNHLQITE
jgi:hypothetical protein